MEHKVRYIEKFPEELNIVFDTREEYYKFFNERIDIVSKKLDFYNPNSKFRYDSWVHTSIKLNNDGSPRKYNPATHLQSKESKAKQKIKWKEYQERKKKDKELNDELIKENHIKAIKILIDNNIDITKLKIEPKFPHF